MVATVRDVTPEQVRWLRVRAQQLGREHGSLDDTAVLDLGVQDTGTGGARWSLTLRGLDVPAPDASRPAAEGPGAALALAWTLRGAPHAYRRRDLTAVTAATAPFSEADAGKRVFAAVKPLRAAGIGALEALDEVAAAMRALVGEPMVKGDVSGALAAGLGAPYLRDCRACGVTHLYEMPFRLAALKAGLELRPGTSPPVLDRIPGAELAPRQQLAPPAPAPLDVVRGHLALLGPTTPRHVAAALDAPLPDVRGRWPDDAVEVRVAGQARSLLAADLDRLDEGPVRGALLLGPYDPFLQARDREVLAADPARAKELWPVLGRPGAVLVDGAVVGSWRPRASGGSLAVAVTWWGEPTAAVRAGVEDQAERLAAHRGLRPAGTTTAPRSG